MGRQVDERHVGISILMKLLLKDVVYQKLFIPWLFDFDTSS